MNTVWKMKTHTICVPWSPCTAVTGCCTQLWDEGVHTTAMWNSKMHILYHIFYSSSGNDIQPNGFYFLEQFSLFQCPVAKRPSLGLSTFDILLKIICLITQLHSLPPRQKVPFLLPYFCTEDCVTIHVMHDSSLAPLSPAPRQIYFYKCHANSWCCKEKLLPSFIWQYKELLPQCCLAEKQKQTLWFF